MQPLAWRIVQRLVALPVDAGAHVEGRQNDAYVQVPPSCEDLLQDVGPLRLPLAHHVIQHQEHIGVGVFGGGQSAVGRQDASLPATATAVVSSEMASLASGVSSLVMSGYCAISSFMFSAMVGSLATASVNPVRSHRALTGGSCDRCSSPPQPLWLQGQGRCWDLKLHWLRLLPRGVCVGPALAFVFAQPGGVGKGFPA